ncbi:alpha-ketoglutarate-dependent dioxygenase AlkB family protein [Methylobacterium sp. J-076]|uniref:alpha-ketoglutarate-dependent dioxygenase AlkB family protein n=1 Tax=Methylobacterium sp. J-076 TaxID=2836655 RepID=UPI001FB9E6C7|nr:alpha-ketoglutarate-dependent dioxygenase AlkB [Methylobacterium sp. J-076]MCJ2015052.1 alpha-ketoglutarate-dependent dioxygenase AlkB [Methylobacterium sp. J-076]
MSVALRPGLIHYPGFLDGEARSRLAGEVADILAEAPPFTPRMPRTGKPFSVRMGNAGPLGWVSDERGYRYQPHHPETGQPWPPLPATALAVWEAIAAYPAPPEACLVNLYGPGTRMGLHQDRDEDEFDAPVLSLSLGAPALFRYGGLARSDPTRSVRLMPGDALVIGGPSRLVFHGIDRIYAEPDLLAEDLLPGLLPPGGRINLTLRRVSRPQGV